MNECSRIGVDGCQRSQIGVLEEHQPSCFREFSHRIGSSLQTVAALARRSEREILRGTDPQTALDALRMVQRSVSAIAYVQRLLYIDTPASGATRDLVETLGAHLKAIYDRSGIDIVIADAADLPIAHAQTIGLILCELITNSLRHGFADGECGQVAVAVTHLPPGTIRLTVADNGKGFPGEMPPVAPERGLGLVSEFIGDACGRIKLLKRDRGIAWQVDLPLR
ncbi:sensor histidine kinase [Erythrobacter ani]|uniref:histidine kinase n=1 Tax=Erythrobacter ani TaxID=2827235 RepID=A0ABS6SK95_9SPHN|nr:sensor histidine kinase [Erythrobacter ani]MBV7265459.1 sensor histidine kinase [Erythrobacter ani]